MESDNHPFPQESTSQRIGQDAIRAFNNAHPLSWRPRDMSGDDDAGLDMQIQVLRNERYWTMFGVQLKSSKSPRIKQTSDTISVSLKASTLNYYANITSPLMLAFVDLSVNLDPRKCSVFYVWIHDQLKKLLGGRRLFPTDQKTYTFNIPRKNVLDSSLDVIPYLAEHLVSRRAADGLFGAIASAVGGSGDEVLRLSSQVERRMEEGGPSLLSSFIEESDAPWLDIELGPSTKELRRISRQLDDGWDSEAAGALREIEQKLDSLGSHEKAEYYNLLSRNAELRGDLTGAARAARLANRTRPDLGRYLGRRVEADLQLTPETAMRRLAERMLKVWPERKGSIVIAVKAKLLALMGRYTDALFELDSLPSEKSCTTAAIVYFLKREWDTVVAHVDRSLSTPNLVSSKIRQLNLLASAALLRLGIPEIGGNNASYVVPVMGSANADSQVLRACWNRCLLTLEMMRNAGWPSEVKLLIEPLCLCALHLNQVKRVYEDIWDIVKARPHCREAIEFAERLAVMLGDSGGAIKANELLPKSPETKVRRAILAFGEHDYSTALQVVGNLYDNRSTRNDMDPTALVIAAVSANRLIRVDEEEHYRALLVSEAEFEAEYAVYVYLTKLSGSPLEKRSARDELYKVFCAHRDSEFIQSTLFTNLHTQDEQDARFGVEIAAEIAKHRLFTYDETLHLAQAFVTLRHWQELLELTDSALSRFDGDPRLLAIKAIAFEGLGETAGAIQILEDVIRKSERDPVALDAYASINIRCGFVEKAIAQVEKLISRERKTTRKLELLRTLFVLENVRRPVQQKLVEIAWQYGRGCDQEKEVEEGVFLQLFFMATLNDKVNVTDAQKMEFDQRAKRFVEAFPTSQFLRAVALPKDANAEELLRTFEEITGLTGERKAWIKARIEKLRRGEEVFPFMWRPRNILVNVSDSLQLWQIAKVSRRDAREFHLQIATADRTPVAFRSVEGQMPLLDLTALILLEELQLFPHLRKLFRRVAVAKSTIALLQQYCIPFAGSICPDVARRITETLRSNLECVVQPGTNLGRKNGQNWEGYVYEDIRELAKSGRYLLYVDDVIFRYWATEQSDVDPGICTTDIIEWLVEKGILEEAVAAEKIGALCQWNVGGVRVSLPLFIAAIPERIRYAKSVMDAEEVLTQEFPFNAISDALWDYKANYEGVASHIAGILLYVIPQKAVSDETILGLWRRWMMKVRIRSDVQIKGEQHCQNVFFRIAKSDDLDARGMERLWALYRKMVELEHGERMSKEIEEAGIRTIGRVLGKYSRDNMGIAEAEKFRGKVASGLVAGTWEHSVFDNAYVQARIEAAKKRK